MSPNEQGRHCNICCKTVVDFTAMTDEQVKYFFINKKKEENVCGRFKKEQLQRIKVTLPYNIYTVSMPLWKQFLTACLLAFSSMLFSCDAMIGKTTGDTAESLTGVTLIEPSVINIDTTIEPICTTLTGDTVAITTKTTTLGLTTTITIEPEDQIPTMGKPIVQEPDTSQSILKGEIAIDTNVVINPIAIDSVQPKKYPNCDNKFITL